MRVAIIDYGSGNLRSATKAFERAAREAGIAAEIDLTDDPDRVRSADRIVLPGVGLTALGETAGLGFTSAALSLLVSIYVGLEGPALRINALRRRGWRDRGVVEAANAREAEIRYLAGEEEPEEIVVEVSPPLAPTAPRTASTGPALGLLGYPGRH